MTLGTDIKVIPGVGKPEVFKKNPIHLIGIMLTGMEHKIIDPVFFAGSDNG
jgi:hypothetical protein